MMRGYLTRSKAVTGRRSSNRSPTSGAALMALSGDVGLAVEWLQAASTKFDPRTDDPRHPLGAKVVVEWQAGQWDRAGGLASSVRIDIGERSLAWWAVLADTAVITTRGLARRSRAANRDVRVAEPYNCGRPADRALPSSPRHSSNPSRSPFASRRATESTTVVSERATRLLARVGLTGKLRSYPKQLS